MSTVVLLTTKDPHHKYVLTQGYQGRLMNDGDYAVYKGEHSDTDQYIASTGDKVSWEKAQELFPRHITSEEKYRR